MRNSLNKFRSLKLPIIVAIESSCDDTSLAILTTNNKLIYEFKSSQKRIHQPFGGVVPQLASQGHRNALIHFSQNELFRHIISKHYLKLIAITAGPGLGSCLNVGFEFATNLSRSMNVPLLPVNHLLGHLLSVDFTCNIKFPRLSLIVSGGNTQLVFSRSAEIHHILGVTIDDALGEALDKCARLLNCNWSDSGGSGKELEKMASKGKSLPCNIKILENYKDPLSFSFSGIKTGLKTFISENSEELTKKEDLAATIQETLFDHIVNRVKNCFDVLKNSDLIVRTFSLIGGVAANKRLRKRLENLCSENKVNLVLPSMSLCTDNAVMIGVAANKIISSSTNSIEKFKIWRVNPDWTLEDLAIKKSKLD